MRMATSIFVLLATYLGKKKIGCGYISWGFNFSLFHLLDVKLLSLHECSNKVCVHQFSLSLRALICNSTATESKTKIFFKLIVVKEIQD